MKWFQRWRARRKLQAQFSHYVASEVIDELVSRPKPDRPTPEPTQLCFILLQVRDDPVAKVPAHMAKAFDLITRREGMVWYAISSWRSRPSARHSATIRRRTTTVAP